ncbi:MAG: rhodanese-like domain-containing protein [bacterium]|nr:rhodanese-like domain-containing protein [bacterium]
MNINNLIGMNNIIDLRPHYLYIQGHIKGAKNIEYDDLLNNYYNYLDKNQTYYLYCQMGKKSKLMSDFLNSIGYKTVNVNGGYVLKR